MVDGVNYRGQRGQVGHVDPRPLLPPVTDHPIEVDESNLVARIKKGAAWCWTRGVVNVDKNPDVHLNPKVRPPRTPTRDAKDRVELPGQVDELLLHGQRWAGLDVIVDGLHREK